jgi:hypothetical protein
MFVPVGVAKPREVELVFEDGVCSLHVEGAAVLRLVDDHLELVRFLPEFTGLTVDDHGRVLVKEG